MSNLLNWSLHFPGALCLPHFQAFHENGMSTCWGANCRFRGAAGKIAVGLVGAGLGCKGTVHTLPGMGPPCGGLGVTAFIIAANHAGIWEVTQVKSEWGTALLFKVRCFQEEKGSGEGFSYPAGPLLRFGSAALKL